MRLRAQIHALKVENAQLRAALAEAQARLSSVELTAERAALEREIRQALGCAEDAPVDWQALATGSGAPACSPPAPASAPKPQP